MSGNEENMPELGEFSNPGSRWSYGNSFGISKESLKNHEVLEDHFKKNNRVKEYAGHSSKVHSVDWNCTGSRLASGSCDRTVCIFDLDDSNKLVKVNQFKGHTDSVDQLCWQPKNPDLVTTASTDKTVRIWDTRASGSYARAVVGTKGENINITWSEDGNYIAVGNKDDLISIIDVRKSKICNDVKFQHEVNEITFGPDSNLLFMTNGQGYVLIYEFPEMKLVHQLRAHSMNCVCIEFDPSGMYFAVGSADASVSLFEAEELACVKTFTNLDWPIRTISFNHDGTLLASASEDLVIDISHVETGNKVCDCIVDDPPYTIAFHPRKNILAFAGADPDKYERNCYTGTIKLFGLPD